MSDSILSGVGGRGTIRFQVHELFPSFQFEGKHHGTRAFFVRFYGCNLKCPECDTPQDVFDFIPLDELSSRIRSEVEKEKFPLVVFTGGEPTLQPLPDLVRSLGTAFPALLAVETNGTRPEVLEKLRDLWITCSPKKEWTKESIELASEVKAVLGMTDPKAIEFAESLNTKYLWIQPMQRKDGTYNLLDTLRFIREHPRWRLSIQVHKLLGLK